MGIPIYFHFTFLVIIPFLAAIFALRGPTVFGISFGYYRLDVSLIAKLLLGTVCAILFFFTILLHELGHSFVAVRHGYKIDSITLFIFGGVARLEDQPRNEVEGWMSFVGPATSFAVGVALLPAALAIGEVRNPGVGLEALGITLGILGFYNLLLGAFNLIPAFPMDGGRILRSVLASRQGMHRGTQTAVLVGKVIAVAMAVVGMIFLELFIIFVALFIYFGASEEESVTRFTLALEGAKVRDIMNTDVLWVTPGMSLAEVLEMMIKDRRTAFPVVRDHTLVGVITAQRIDEVPFDQRGTVTAEAAVDRSPPYVRSYVDATEILKVMQDRRDYVVVLDENDELVGSVTRDELMRVVSVLGVRKGL